MKKILHVIESLEFGGAEKVVVQLANRLSDVYDVTICMTKREGELCKLVSSNIKQICLDGNEGNDFFVIKRLIKIIKDNNIDIVHVHNWSVYIEGILAAKLSGVSNIIHTIHGPYISYPGGFRSKLKKYIRQMLEVYLSKYVRAFVPVSYSIKNYVEAKIKINPDKIFVIHNGVKSLNYHRKDNNLSNKSIKLVMVGRVASIKNHKLMLDALKTLIMDYDISLYIVGDGPYFDIIKKYATKNNLNSCIEFLGFRNDIENILTDKDVFILTSNYEGISIALLESMSMGIPTIATRVGGIPETVAHDKTGLLIEAGDTHGLICAIKYLLENPDIRKQMGLAARDYYLKEFNEDNVIEQYNELYKN